MAVFQIRYPHRFIMQPTTLLQKTAAKEVLFSRKQHDAIRTDSKIYFCIFYNLCIVVMIFLVATSLSIFSITPPFLTQYRKLTKGSYIFNCPNSNKNLIIGLGNCTWPKIEYITYLMCSFFFGGLCNSIVIIRNRYSFIFSLAF